jgi:Xaa-Pro dipeptidase
LQEHNEGTIIAVQFTATWCGPCKQIGPKFQELSKDYPELIYRKVDVDDNEEIQEKCGVTQMPTFQFYKNNEKLYEFTGNKPDMLKLKLKAFAKKSISATQPGGSSKRQKVSSSDLVNEAASPKPPHFSMGPGTYEVEMSMHAENRGRLVAAMQAKGANGLVLLKGGNQECRHDTDTEIIFRQESYFNWAFGIVESEWFGCIDVCTGKTTMFIPRLDPDLSAWIGRIKAPAEFKAYYDVDDVRYVDEMAAFCKEWTAADHAGQPLHVLYGQNTDSGSFSDPAKFDGIDAFPVEKNVLFQIIANCRVFKSPKELALMAHVSKITSWAHVDVMRATKGAIPEYQLESLFRHHIYHHAGCRNCAYTCICACGPNSGTLHYGHAGAPNDRTLQLTDIALLDMGAEYHAYTSDITCSFPVSGKFSDDQKMIFTGVLMAVKSVMDNMRPGISWVDMHRLATKTVIEHLVGGGILKGDVDEMVSANMGATFLPCGLGHFIGCDTHDVGGYLNGNPERIDEGPHGIRKLRTARDLEQGMVLTVEPGIYFVDHLLDLALKDPVKSKFIVPERLAQFRGFGGVRLEDVVTVTADGIDNYTLCPRTIEEIEGVMAGGPWPPLVDAAPWLCRRWETPLPNA